MKNTQPAIGAKMSAKALEYLKNNEEVTRVTGVECAGRNGGVKSQMSGPPSPFWISKTLKIGEFEGPIIRCLGMSGGVEARAWVLDPGCL